MQERANLLKQTVGEGRPAIGIWCSLASAITTEVVAGAGADWLLIDGEHSPNDLRSMLAQLQVVAGFSGCEAVVRLPSDDANQIKQAMDIGARNLMIPNVRTAAQAKSIVAAMSYAPNGFRGFSVAQRANAYGRVKDYHPNAHRNRLIIVQIECETGVANAAEIAAVPGVDVLFVGPGDLSANMGAMGNPSAAHVQEAIMSVLQSAEANGKAAGILAPVHADAQRYISAGFTLVAVGSDLGLLARGSDALVAQFKGN